MLKIVEVEDEIILAIDKRVIDKLNPLKNGN